MIRSLYFIGGLFAMALILFAQTLEPAPAQRAAAEPASAAASVHDPATAIDDLAAWPAAASR